MRDLKSEVVQIYLETLKRIDVETLVRDKVRLNGDLLLIGDDPVDLARFDEIVLVGLGKASLRMGHAVLSLIGDRITRGILVSDRRWDLTIPDRIKMIVGGHPIPNANSIEAGGLMLEEVRSCADRTLLVFLISGGGSALAELPISDTISLQDLQALNQSLIVSGANIHEINIVRKVLSRTKGGRTGYLARKTMTIALYLSDVNSGDVRAIASNPVQPDEVGLEQFHQILSRYRLIEVLPTSIRRVIEECDLTIPRGWQFENGFTQLLVGDNAGAIRAAVAVASSRGFRVRVRDDLVEDDYPRIADEMAQSLSKLKHENPDEVVCVISGGEARCPVRGSGVGGRNQEFVLYSAASLGHCGLGSRAVAFAAGTDGIDGNSGAAGAAIDSGATKRAAQRNQNTSVYFDDSDSNSFFSEAGGLVVTGPAGNNVRDLRIMLAR